MFCPKCGSILRPKKDKKKTVLACSCGYSDKEGKVETEIKEVVHQEDEIEVIQEGASDESLPITDANCDKCGNKKARYWMQQMRAGDEPETRFFKCTKCKHIWRD